ncbi:hypothetical protein IAQ61_011466 [Plenodomus lingam]|nr:hypothetical protein IAQ61_011466 [Plenodomus lingam]
MQLLSFLAITGITSSVTAQSVRSIGKRTEAPRVQVETRQSKSIITTEASKKFIVNGAAGSIPDVDFDIGESYAGLLPISDKANETSELYFWFFPSENPAASEEIVIWLNGGPGCSSLEGFLQENGPISWQYGTGPKPVRNAWSWTNLTNMVWIDQPVGTGFSKGISTATTQEEIAEDFAGFFKNFVNTFGLNNRKIYMTGESYAGRYIPYIADAMLKKNNTEHFNVKGVMLYSPNIAEEGVQVVAPVVPYLDKWSGLFNLNETFTKHIHELADTCGYTEYMKKYLTFPPPSKIPQAPNDRGSEGCDVWGYVQDAVILVNPCFDRYHIATTCPLLWDVLGYPGNFDYLVAGTEIFFNRSAVQAAINAPIQPWSECADGVLGTDNSPQSSDEVLPRIIDALDRTVICHGELDYRFLFNGTLLAIQNMTWGGKQGFQSPPTKNLFIPYHEDISQTSLSAKGVMGKWHTERKLTYIHQSLAGHMVPQYQQSSGFRHLEFLLGRIKDLSSDVPFTTLSQAHSSKGNSNGKRDLAAMKLARDYIKWF